MKLQELFQSSQDEKLSFQLVQLYRITCNGTLQKVIFICRSLEQCDFSINLFRQFSMNRSRLLQIKFATENEKEKCNHQQLQQKQSTQFHGIVAAQIL